DVAEEIELVAAELPHAEDGDTIRDTEVPQAGLDARTGERGQVRDDLFEGGVLDLFSCQAQVLSGSNLPERFVGAQPPDGLFDLGDERLVLERWCVLRLEHALAFGRELQES